MILALVLIGSLLHGTLQAENVKEGRMELRKLTTEEERVILHRGTEAPFTGEYYKAKAAGTYSCKRCSAPLYRSTDKFEAGCGWPSFDAEIEGAVRRAPDADGHRTEITCARCGAHLGHLFLGEGFTDKNVRHCVNSISLLFTPAAPSLATRPVATLRAYFAGGCFWGTEYLMQKTHGVVATRVGYMGGHTDSPTYRDVCAGSTGHAETVEVEYDSAKTSFESLARLFFEIHDPTELNRQGPDVGDQYRSAIFYVDERQRQTAEELIGLLKDKGYEVVTQLAKAAVFWQAEAYHQDYYKGNGKQPYCHAYKKRF